MRTLTAVSILLATSLVMTSMTAVAQARHGQGASQAQNRAQVERGQRDFDRDRMRDRDRPANPSQDRDRDQDRTRAPDNATFGESGKASRGHNGDGIYGGELMSVEERNQYREQLRLTESDPEAQTRFKAQHQEEMQRRAKAQGVTLDDSDDSN